MGYINITTEKNETYSSISNFFIDYYMTSASGEFVKVYLYLVRLLSSKEPVSVAGIADHFNLTEKDICRSIRYWIEQNVMRLEYDSEGRLTGITLLPLEEKRTNSSAADMDSLSLLSADYKKDVIRDTADAGTDNGKSAVHALPPYQADVADDIKAPEKKALTKAIMKKRQGDGVLSDLVFETEAYFGRALSMPEVESLIYIYDQLGFSEELIEYLVEYCLSRNKASMKYVEAVAIAWFEKGITTVAEAKEDSSSYNPFYKKVFKELGISRPRPTSAEQAYIESWLNDLGFSEELVLLACSKAILAKPQSVNFSYIDKILENWHMNGVQSTLDVAQLDNEFRESRADARKSGRSSTKNPNGFAAFTQAASADELGEIEQLLADELNRKKSS